MKIQSALLSLVMVLTLLLGSMTSYADTTPTEAPTSEPAVTAEPAAEPEAVIYTEADYRGAFSNGIYVNLPFNLSLSVPEGWETEYSDEYLEVTSADESAIIGLSVMERENEVTDAWTESLLERFLEQQKAFFEEENVTVTKEEIVSYTLAGRTLSLLWMETDDNGESSTYTLALPYTGTYVMLVAIEFHGGDAHELLNLFTPVTWSATPLAGNPMGGYAGNQYVNPYFNFVLALDDNWEFADNKSLAALNNLDYASLAEESWEETLANSSSLVIAYAQLSDGSQAITFTLSPMENADQLLDDASMAESLEASIEPLTTTFTNMGYTVESITVETAEFMGKTTPCLHIGLSFNGTYLYETIMLIPGAEYLLTAAVVNTDASADALLNLFAPVTRSASPLAGTPLGVCAGNQYLNPYFGLVLTLEDSWKFWSDETLAVLNNLEDSSLIGEKWEEILANNSTLIIALAQLSDGSQAITFTLNSAEGIDSPIDDAFISATLHTSMESLTTAYTNKGYTIESMVVETTEFMGKTVPCLHIVLFANGAYMYETIVLIPGEAYLLTLVFVNTGAPADDLLPMVSVLE